MDLRGNQITIRELLSNPNARRIGQQEFPQLMNPIALSMVGNMTLAQVMNAFGGEISIQKRERILTELKKA